MTKLLLTWLRSAWLPPLLVLACALLSALMLPHWFNVYTARAAERLDIEATIRWYMGVTMALALGVSAVSRWPHWSCAMKWTWGALVGLLMVLVPLFYLDDNWLWKEESWLRFPTAGALIGAGLASLALARLRGSSAMPNRQTLFWLVLGAAFVFLAADELLELHERMGDWLTDMPAFEFIDQDWITLAYAVIGASVLLLYWLLLGRHTSVDEHWLLRGYMTAVAVFAFSQICDTFNPQALAGLKVLADGLAERGHRFPDIWFVLYRPRQLMNAIEELLECIAAALLMVFTIRLVVITWCRRATDVEPAAEGPAKCGPVVRVARWALAAIVVTLATIGWPAATTSLPFPGAKLPITVKASDRSQRFLPAIRLTGGGRVTAEPGGALLFRPRDGSANRRVWPRQLLRGLRGVRINDDGHLELRTADRRKRAFMPHLVWRTGAGGDQLNGG